MPPDARPTTDGRRLRREHGRLAVIDAVIDLMLEGDAAPTADRVADRAHVSVASVHRYFGSLDELRLTGIRRYLERIDHLLEVRDVGEGPLTSRIERLVSSRLDYHESTINVARLARRRAGEVDEVGQTLRQIRTTLADQLDHHFATELAPLPPGTRRERVAVMATLTAFESWEQLDEQGFEREAIARAWCASLLRLLDHDES